MKFKSLHPGFKLPALGSGGAGAYDIFMPESGRISGYVFDSVKIPLGFAAEVPAGHVALILPRSGVGAEYGLELENTAGVIDSDYRGEWAAELHLKKPYCLEWKAGDRLLQFLLIPVLHVELEVLEELGETERGAGGFGSTDCWPQRVPKVAASQPEVPEGYKDLPPFLQRLLVEKQELQERQDKLEAFIGTKQYNALDHTGQVLLSKQSNQQHSLLQTLNQRINGAIAKQISAAKE